MKCVIKGDPLDVQGAESSNLSIFTIFDNMLLFCFKTEAKNIRSDFMSKKNKQNPIVVLLGTVAVLAAIYMIGNNTSLISGTFKSMINDFFNALVVLMIIVAAVAILMHYFRKKD